MISECKHNSKVSKIPYFAEVQLPPVALILQFRAIGLTLKVYDIEDEGNPEISILTTKDCPRCGRKIGADEDFCPKCRLPTNIDYEKQVLIEEEERGIKEELNSIKKQMKSIQ